MREDEDVSAEPIVDWIGDIPIYHGERADSSMCLCGHEEYFACPGWLSEGGIGALEVAWKMLGHD